MAVSQDAKIYLVRRCGHCQSMPMTAVHLDRCPPRHRMYSRWADAHGAGAPPEVVEYGKKEYERGCKQQIQEVNLAGSSD
eukprot:3095509-Pyramimonas_sp.AAC.1